MANGYSNGVPKYDAPPYYHNGRSKRRRWCIVGGAVVLLVIVVCAIAIPLSTKKNGGDSAAQSDQGTGNFRFSNLATACNETLYPSVCMDSLSKLPNANSTNPKDLVTLAVTAAMNGVSSELSSIQELLNSSTNDRLLSAAGAGCVDDLMDSLDTMNQTLERIHGLNLSSLQDDMDDLQMWMSSALTLQQTCEDDFEVLSVNITGPVAEFLQHGNDTEKLLSNALAFITTMRSVAGDALGRRLLLSDATDWVRPLQRRLLASNGVAADVVVAADGSGDHKSIQAAVNAAPLKSSTRYVIHIKAGRYKEIVNVPKKAWNIVFIGDGANVTVITGNRSVIANGVTTSKTSILTVQSMGFIGRDFAVENTAGAANHQAVAMRVTGDFSAFWRCTFLGYQDTLYTHSNRQFYRDCTVVGTVDFIFGNAAVQLQTSNILATAGLTAQPVTYTAQGRLDPNQPTGISFQRCNFDATASFLQEASQHQVFLGRPWKVYSRTVIMQSTLSSIVQPEGWLTWNGDNSTLATVYYAEYRNQGPGAETAQRVKWSQQITSASDALKFTANAFIAAASWLPQTKILYASAL